MGAYRSIIRLMTENVDKERKSSLVGAIILVVDDDEATRGLYTRVFTEWGAKVTTVTHGAEALEILKEKMGESPFDLIITDWERPGDTINGPELLRRIARLALAKKTPTLLASARFTDRTEIIGAIRQGATAGLSKPFSLEELQKTAESLITASRQQSPSST